MPLKTLPGVLKTVATWNPLTSLSEAGRNLFGNVPADPKLRNISSAWSIQHPELYTLIWIVLILLILAVAGGVVISKFLFLILIIVVIVALVGGRGRS